MDKEIQSLAVQETLIYSIKYVQQTFVKVGLKSLTDDTFYTLYLNYFGPEPTEHNFSRNKLCSNAIY